MIIRAKACLGPIALAVVLAVTGFALAAEKKPAREKLPGVDDDHRIVKPYAPEPESSEAPATNTGGWDVKVSGSLTVDTGTGGLPLPRN